MELCANRSRNVFASVSFDLFNTLRVSNCTEAKTLLSGYQSAFPRFESYCSRVLCGVLWRFEQEPAALAQGWATIGDTGNQHFSIFKHISRYLNIRNLNKIETNILYSFAHRSLAHLSSLWRWSSKPLENLAARSMRRKRWKAWTHVFSMEKSLETSLRHNSSQGFFWCRGNLPLLPISAICGKPQGQCVLYCFMRCKSV